MARRHQTDFLIIGSGAGAVGVLSELIESNKKVVVVEQGKKDAQWGKSIPERGKNIYRENGRFPESREGIGYYRHLGVGGTVEISCANGIRPSARYLSKLGIDIQDELDQLETELGVAPLPASHIGQSTRHLTRSACQLGFRMAPTPKFIDSGKCRNCAQCELMCMHDAVWSTRRRIEAFEQRDNFKLMDNVTVQRLKFSGSTALAVCAVAGEQPLTIEADTIILSAGGLGSPVILQNSGIKAGSNLHLDLYTVVYGRSRHFNAMRDIPMATVYQHPDDTFIIAPYLDIDIWHGLYHHGFSKWLGGEHMAGLMVKIADADSGRITADGKVSKKVTDHDQHIFKRGVEMSKAILLKAGASHGSITTTKPRGAHPGGTCGIGRVVDGDLRVFGYDNLFVADAGVLPAAMGKPPILTIMALGKRLGKSLLTV